MKKIISHINENIITILLILISFFNINSFLKLDSSIYIFYKNSFIITCLFLLNIIYSYINKKKYKSNIIIHEIKKEFLTLKLSLLLSYLLFHIYYSIFILFFNTKEIETQSITYGIVLFSILIYNIFIIFNISIYNKRNIKERKVNISNLIK